MFLISVTAAVVVGSFLAGYSVRDWQSRRRRATHREKFYEVYNRTGGVDPTVQPTTVRFDKAV